MPVKATSSDTSPKSSKPKTVKNERHNASRRSSTGSSTRSQRSDAREAASSKQSDKDNNLQDAVEVRGVLDMMSDGYGFLRQSGLVANQGDVYVSSSQIRRFDLRVGDEVVGMARRPKDNEKYFTI